ncbi:MAG: PilZ domain-containing protein [Oleiphilaceae bacterium]|nr:PilZ domain-containing protein [Oleiphilaceae bacterium]
MSSNTAPDKILDKTITRSSPRTSVVPISAESAENNDKNGCPEPERSEMNAVSAKPNLRNQQRVDADLEVSISRSDRMTITCRCTNLSRAGMTLACDELVAQQLLPDEKSPAPGEWVKVAARFSLPLADSTLANVYGEGVLIHLRRVNRETFHVGIQFCSFEGAGHDYVDQFVTQKLAGSI